MIRTGIYRKTNEHFLLLAIGLLSQGLMNDAM
jgi:hypothetical protein